ncbi:MAG: Gfo/Idh/MocA family oxidoreductase [Devosia nanyangense]|uniref:Gfo/Idh/MocA family oxidoreductase n=1 Tax=Devosia nanyangense TaxID=1228055 RepID=A0A933L8E8_9HYPH|nr:Gfo/Idh/MocA family oxidoreductase [Devosia nanyangense]
MQFRAVLAGCGAMSRGWLKAIAETPALRDRITIVGLNDINPDAANRLATEFGLTRAAVETNLEALLAGTRPDLVFDMVIPGARHDVVATALEHGCHVLSEKPMATSLEEARDLVARATTAGKVHAIVQNRRFNNGVRRIKATLGSGALGTLNAIHCDFFVGAHFGGFREQMEHVLLVDMAIHTLDAARYVSGKQPLAVYCHEANPKSSWYAQGSVANAIFEFSDDVLFTYRGSWSAEGANTSWDSSWRIVGSKGTLLWDGADKFEASIVAGSEGFFRPLEPLAVLPAADAGQTLGHASVLLDFIDAIEQGRAPETVSSDNINSLAMVFAAIESARTRQRVAIAA